MKGITARPNITKYSFLLCCFLFLFASAQAQTHTLYDYQLSNSFVNDFKVSPDGQHLVFNTMVYENNRVESTFYLQDLLTGAKKMLGKKDAYIQGWVDKNHIVFGNSTDDYFIQNVHTLKIEKFTCGFSMYSEPLFISKGNTVVCDIEMEKTTYKVFNGKKLENTLTVDRFLDMNVFDVASNSILEISPKKGSDFSNLEIYQFAYADNSRNKIASIPTSKTSIISEIQIQNNKIYYLENVQTYSPIEEHLWDKLRVKLCVFDLSTQKHSIVHTFDEGVECLNLEVIGSDKYLLMMKDHKNEEEEIVETEDNEGQITTGFDFSSTVKVLEKTKKQAE